MIDFKQLRFGNIVGIIDSYDAVHSVFTGDKIECHADYWPNQTRCQWRWSFSQSIYWITFYQKPTEEQFIAIQDHLTKNYGLKWWDNGHFDIDHFLEKAGIDRYKHL